MSKCFDRILRLVNYRERCSEELYVRLVEKEKFSKDEFFKALDKAQSCGLVDDARYAEMYAFNKLQSYRGAAGIIKHFGKMKIDYLSMKKVKELIDNALTYEIETALEYIKVHPSKAKDQFSGNVRKLINRGYSPSSAIAAANKYKTSNCV